jgi:hypothetical protein
MKRYRVETVHWAGAEAGPLALAGLLNEAAEDGWELSFIVPTLADTSIRALVGAASAGTTEMAVVLQREE